MNLYYYETLNPRKACAVARYLNLPVEFVRVDLTRGEQKTPEFLALNPNGKVPVLRDGDWSVWEANAIMCYLSDEAKAMPRNKCFISKLSVGAEKWCSSIRDGKRRL